MEPVIVRQKTTVEEVWECPHCRQEILEKHMSSDGANMIHTDCGGRFSLPPLKADEKKTLENWGVHIDQGFSGVFAASRVPPPELSLSYSEKLLGTWKADWGKQAERAFELARWYAQAYGTNDLAKLQQMVKNHMSADGFKGDALNTSVPAAITRLTTAITPTASTKEDPFAEKMMPGQTPYTPEEKKKRDALIEDAAKASEEVGDDELEEAKKEQS